MKECKMLEEDDDEIEEVHRHVKIQDRPVGCLKLTLNCKFCPLVKVM